MCNMQGHDVQRKSINKEEKQNDEICVNASLCVTRYE